jgi:anti-sigma B factor antagonist
MQQEKNRRIMTQLKTELTQAKADTWILKLVGGIDSDTHHLMWSGSTSADLLKRLLEAGARKLVIDLEAADRIDSHGLRLLLNAHKEFARKKMGIVLRKPNSHLRRLFQIMQFDRVFVVESDE